MLWYSKELKRALDLEDCGKKWDWSWASVQIYAILCNFVRKWSRYSKMCFGTLKPKVLAYFDPKMVTLVSTSSLLPPGHVSGTTVHRVLVDFLTLTKNIKSKTSIFEEHMGRGLYHDLIPPIWCQLFLIPPIWCQNFFDPSWLDSRNFEPMNFLIPTNLIPMSFWPL